MKLRKSYDSDKLTYVLNFEISPTELIAAGGNKAWKSKYIVDYLELLQKVADMNGLTGTTARKKEDFADILREARQQAYSSYQNPYQQAYDSFNGGSPYSQGTHQTRTPPKPTWATILGVESTATKDQIKARYRELAKQNHPDRGGDPVKFAKITEAYEQATR